MYGHEGDDVLSGDGDDDHLFGGQGNDLMSGGAGADTFVWLAGDADHSPDPITDA